MVFYKKKGFPETGELVLCKVTKILPHSVFLEITEYKDKQGMLHISEISSKWIKNINDYVQINKQIICKVEKVNREKGYIDLSLKRVSGGEKKQKMQQVKQENRVEKMLEYAGKQAGVNLEEMYKKYLNKALKEYDLLQELYDDYKESGEKALRDLGMDKKLVKEVVEQFTKAIKKARARTKKEIRFVAVGEDGVKNIKGFVKEITGVGDENNRVEITYIDSPRYLLSIDSENYKKANGLMKKIEEKIKETCAEHNILLVE